MAHILLKMMTLQEASNQILYRFIIESYESDDLFRSYTDAFSGSSSRAMMCYTVLPALKYLKCHN